MPILREESQNRIYHDSKQEATTEKLTNYCIIAAFCASKKFVHPSFCHKKDTLCVSVIGMIDAWICLQCAACTLCSLLARTILNRSSKGLLAVAGGFVSRYEQKEGV
jgi:hypothetical protein